MEMLNEILVNVFDLLQGVALTLAQGLRKFFISRYPLHQIFLSEPQKMFWRNCSHYRPAKVKFSFVEGAGFTIMRGEIMNTKTLTRT